MLFVVSCTFKLYEICFIKCTPLFYKFSLTDRFLHLVFFRKYFLELLNNLYFKILFYNDMNTIIIINKILENEKNIRKGLYFI